MPLQVFLIQINNDDKMTLQNIRKEVMQTIEKSMDELLSKYLRPVETIWQPSDLLPDSTQANFFDEVKENPGYS